MKSFKTLLMPVLIAGACVLPGCGSHGYKINGVIDANGEALDSISLCEVIEGQLVPVETVAVVDSKFTFEGVQDSVKAVYLDCPLGQVELYLEDGDINVYVSSDSVSTVGTKINDINNALRLQIMAVVKEYNEANRSMADTTLTLEERAAAQERIPELIETYETVIKNGTKANITNPVGITYFKRSFVNNTLEENDSLLQAIPEEYKNDPVIQKIAEQVNVEKATSPGQKYTDFTLSDPEGNEVSLSRYVTDGKVVLVDFWASWCGPCRAEMPNLVELYKKYSGDRFEIVGVSLDQDKDSWLNAVKQLGITWPQMSDLKGWNCEAAQIYSVHAIPCTVLVDGQGNIVARNLRGEELEAKVAELLDK